MSYNLLLVEGWSCLQFIKTTTSVKCNKTRYAYNVLTYLVRVTFFYNKDQTQLALMSYFFKKTTNSPTHPDWSRMSHFSRLLLEHTHIFSFKGVLKKKSCISAVLKIASQKLRLPSSNSPKVTSSSPSKFICFPHKETTKDPIENVPLL